MAPIAGKPRHGLNAQQAPLWRWPELATALGFPECPGPDITGVDIDSRTLMPGALFVALRGERDGHEFVAAAAEAGASGALVEHRLPVAIAQLEVFDTLRALETLGRAARARCSGLICAITGSSGKTTAKSFTAAALGAHSSQASFNNHIGVPLSLVRMPGESHAGVFEIGTNHPGEIAPLAQLVRPHIAIVLNVFAVHSANFRASGMTPVEAIRREKLSIAAGLDPNGTLVVPAGLSLEGSPWAGEVVRFGAADAAAEVLGFEAAGRARLRIGKRMLSVRVPDGGRVRAESALVALLCAELGGVDLELAARRIETTATPAGRGRRTVAAGVTIIDESYNANPHAMLAALETLRGVPGERHLALLGDMLELDDEAAAHAELAGHCAGLDRVLFVGPRSRHAHRNMPPGSSEYISDPAAFDIAGFADDLRPGDVLLIKASNRIFWSRGVARTLIERLEARSAHTDDHPEYP